MRFGGRRLLNLLDRWPAEHRKSHTAPQQRPNAWREEQHSGAEERNQLGMCLVAAYPKRRQSGLVEQSEARHRENNNDPAADVGGSYTWRELRADHATRD